MTKTLTEQFRDGSFECGVYYCKVKDDGEEETKKLLLYHDGCEHGYAQQFGYEEDFPYEDILEVLAPVPDYQTWKAFQQHFVDKTELEVKLKKAYEQLEQQSIKVVELQEQLNEANEVIKLYAKGTFFVKAREWNGKYYSTDPLYGSGLVDDFGKEYDAEVPCANDTEPAENYLKKWGVK